MQKLLRRAPFVFFAYLLLTTLLCVALNSLNYGLIVTNRILWFALSLLVPVSLTVISIVKRNELSKASDVVAQTLPVLIFVYYYFIDSLISGVPTSLVAIHTLIIFLCAYTLSLLKMSSYSFHWITSLLNTILLLLFVALFFFAVTFGSLGERSVFKESVSPSEQYMASIEVVDSGALGGATNVLVEDLSTSIPVGFGRFTRVQ